MLYSRRLDAVAHSATIEISDRVKRLRAEGRDVINMAAARPNFDAPPEVKAATIRALEDPQFSAYTESRGLLELREAVSRRLESDLGLRYDPQSEILVTVGQREGMFVALQALVDPGDHVLVPDPGWVTYRSAVALAGGEPVSIGFSPGDGFRPMLDDIERGAGDGARTLILNTPANPTGTVYSRRELEGIRDVAVDSDMIVITDEIYAPFLYDGKEHVSPASLEGMFERTLVTGAVSKAWAMTGWRVGFAAGPAELIDRMLMIHQHLVSCPCAFAQKGAVTALTGTAHRVDEMVASYRRRRDILARGFRDLPGMEYVVPEGACFFFPAFPGIAMGGRQLAAEFLERAGLALTPGEAFGPAGAGRLRISFAATPEDLLPDVLDRMSRVLTALVR